MSERPSRPPAFVVCVDDGPDRGASAFVAAAPVLVGRAEECALRLHDARVAPRHAAFELDAEDVVLRDLSDRGVAVDGLRVIAAVLRGGERVRIGETLLRLARVRDGADVDVADATRFGRLVGASAEMRRVYALVERLAASSLPVVVEGEAGTGKGLLAEVLHDASARARGPLVRVEGAQVEPHRLAEELFGVGESAGALERADGGTLVLDELDDVDAPLRPTIVRALERGEATRVSDGRRRRVDARVVAIVRAGDARSRWLRDELLARLAAAAVAMPPLRRREGDVDLLARHFWSELGGAGEIPERALLELRARPWPGNVRELRAAVELRLVLGDAGAAIADASVGSIEVERILALDLPLSEARAELVAEFERRYVARALARHGGNVAHAARASGVARRYFQRLRARQTR